MASGTYTIGETLMLASGSSPVSLPATAVGSQAASQNVLFSFASDLIISSISVPQSQGGAQEFVVGGVSACAVDGVTTIPAGTVCSVPVRFQPAYPGLRQAPLVVKTNLGRVQIGLEGIGQSAEVMLTPGMISTVAGNGILGYSGNGGLATNTGLDDPQAVVMDAAGNMYIADTPQIRKVDAATGLISTIAGNGDGDDGSPALAAGLSGPTALAMDAAGNLYIADPVDERIRKIDAATGIISTVAGQSGCEGYQGDGGAATQACLDTPTGIAVDTTGNLYIADTNNGRVRKGTLRPA